MTRFSALVLATALASEPGCAHQQVTHRQLAIGLGVAAAIAAVVVLYVELGCGQHDPRCDESN